MKMIPELHSYEKQYSLGGNGLVVLKVFVTKRISTVNLKSVPVYLIRTALKVSIHNKNDFVIVPGALLAYHNYPALFDFTQFLECLLPGESQGFRLLNYAPKTLNSSITSSRSENIGETKSNSVQQSVGSTTSQTNSFGVNIQGGIMMDMPMFTTGLSYDHAYTSAQSRETATASGTNADRQTGDVESFSVKDWGVYAKINQDALQVQWICAQEYPWDVLQFRSKDSQGNIDLPENMAARMLDGGCVLPPSQLSLFGTDFTFVADWSFKPAGENFDTSSSLFNVLVKISYLLASHERVGAGPKYHLAAKLGQPANDVLSLGLTWGELECLALNPVVPGRNDASLNFQKLPAERFPTVASAALTITSPTNSLFCEAPRFGPGMIVDVAAKAAAYTLKFKVTDTVGELTLYLKHWKLDTPGLALQVTINDTVLPVLFVDALQGEGGAGNLTTITLRSTDYMDEDFVDYVIVGLNVVTVTVSCNGTVPVSPTRYCLAAAVVS